MPIDVIASVFNPLEFRLGPSIDVASPLRANPKGDAMAQIFSQAFIVVLDDGEKCIAHEYRDKGNRSYRLENGDELSLIDDDTFKNIDTEQILRRER